MEHPSTSLEEHDPLLESGPPRQIRGLRVTTVLPMCAFVVLIMQNAGWYYASKGRGSVQAAHNSVLGLADTSSCTGGVDVWYVNMDGQFVRDRCMRKQLELANVTPSRYEADVFSPCLDNDTFKQCLRTQGGGDCIKGGIDWPSVQSHGSPNGGGTGITNASIDVSEHIISNWCSHKRLFSKLADDEDTAEYVLVLEDDTFISERLHKELIDFTRAFRHWDLAIVDPFLGQNNKSYGNCGDYQIGSLNGRAVLNATSREFNYHCVMDKKCSMCGAQAWLLRKASLKKIVRGMEAMPTLALDWFPINWKDGVSLAWKPEVALNPYGMGSMPWPEFCGKDIDGSSTIGNVGR